MAEMLTKSFLMGLDRSTRKMEFAEPTAEEIENLPYAEAVEYLRKRDVLNKVDYDKLSAQLKFRAFTASRISDGALLKRINSELIKNIEAGNGLKDFLGMTKTDVLSKVGLGNAGGWYWETVYRTNVQTAYNAGRMMGYEEDKPLALELVVIDDSRTTDYCRQYAGKGFILPYDDPFWKTHIPPFHFNCRTTVRAIYDEREIPEQWSSKADIEKPAKGFGNNPVVDDSWWKELSSQVRQAKMYGVQGEIEAAKEILIDKGRKEDLIKEAAQQIEKINNNHNELVDDVKEIFKEQALIKDSPEYIQKAIFKQIENFSDDQLTLLKKYAGSIPTEISKTVEVSEFNGEKIILKAGKQAGDYWHEFGHYLDNILAGDKGRVRDVLQDFSDTLYSDALSWVNKNSGEKPLTSFDRIPRKIADKLNDMIRIRAEFDKYDDVSDIMEGLTKGKIGGYEKCGSGHGVEYMLLDPKVLKRIEGESIANFTDVWFRYKIQSAEGIKEVFPNAYKMYIDYLRGKING